MFKVYISSLFLILALMSCGEDEPEVFLTVDEYISAKSISPQETSTGLRYIIIEEGEDPKPKLGANININYEGYFLQDPTRRNFASGENDTFKLADLILGWQEGLKLIGTGGKITLLVPSGLAYGIRGNGTIPSNTDIGFDIDLLGFSYDTIKDFVADNELVTEVTDSGLHYIILEEGTDPKPTLTSIVSYTNSKYFLRGERFASGDSGGFKVEDIMLLGMQEGIQLIGVGGQISLFIPSELAYGVDGEGCVPGDTDIGINILLTEVN